MRQWRERWSVRFTGALATIAIGVPVITFGSVAYWDELTTSETAEAVNPTCEPNTYGIVVSGTRYVVEEFTDTSATCDWTVPTGVTEVDVLVVGGGGGGGENAGFGGAGGGVSETTITVQPLSAVTVSVGLGGRGGGSSLASNAADSQRNGGDGGLSTLTATSPAATVTANGGEGGLNHWSDNVCSSTASQNTHVAVGGSGSTSSGGNGGS
ncbi:MAG: glycine-rich domain-containing protein, partial [Ilumatobacteraceae bacterium]